MRSEPEVLDFKSPIGWPFPVQTGDEAWDAPVVVAEPMTYRERRLSNRIRHFTWAIYWFSEPLACTYATLLTVPEDRPGDSKSAECKINPIPVAVVEAESEVLRGLEHSLNQIPDYYCAQTANCITELLQQSTSPAAPPRLILYNQNFIETTPDAFVRELQKHWPGAVALPFGIFGSSDELFISMTGMDNGYFLRRRPLTQMLEPLAGFWEGTVAAGEVRRPLESYFQNLIFAVKPGIARAAGTHALTPRETEVLRCLCAGHTDKTMAAALDISIWTAHAHVKRIFEKFNVHTRAEAVRRYLENCAS